MRSPRGLLRPPPTWKGIFRRIESCLVGLRFWDAAAGRYRAAWPSPGSRCRPSSWCSSQIPSSLSILLPRHLCCTLPFGQVRAAGFRHVGGLPSHRGRKWTQRRPVAASSTGGLGGGVVWNLRWHKIVCGLRQGRDARYGATHPIRAAVSSEHWAPSIWLSPTVRWFCAFD